MNEFKVTVIIPAYNEGRTIGDLVSKIRSMYLDIEIIVINDGSTDDTAVIAKQAGAIVYNHPYNIGNGAAVKTGIRHASGDILVFMDGDFQHDPEDIGKLLENIPEYDMVVGARSIKGQSSIGRAFGNKIYNWLASYVAMFPIKDLTSGFRAIKTDLARQLVNLLPNTYSYPSTMTLSVLRSGRSLIYIPIKIQNRKMGKSNLNLIKDGVRFFMIIIRICTLYSPWRVFLPVSFFMFVLGLSYYGYTYFTENRFTNMSALLLTTSVLIFMMGLISDQICQMRFEKSDGK